MKTVLKALALAAAAALAAPFASAQSFPEKPITIVVPFPPGGSTDLLARKIGEAI